MLFSKQTPAAGGTAFAQFDAAWAYDGNGYILNDTGTSLDVRIGASGSVQTLAAGGTLPIKLVHSMAELYVRRTDQSITQVTVEAQVGTGSAGGGTSAEVGVIAAQAAAASTTAHNAAAGAHDGVVVANIDGLRAISRSSAIAIWPINEISGTAIGDITGKGHPAVAKNLVLGSAGFDGRCGYIDGTAVINLYSAKLAADFSNSSGTFTILFRAADAAVWVDGVGRTLAVLYLDTNNYVWITKSTSNNAISMDYKANGVLTPFVASKVHGVDWFRLTMTWDNGTVAAYVNGMLMGPKVSGLSPLVGALNASYCSIGSLTDGAQPAIGYFQNCGLFSTALTQQQIGLISARLHTPGSGLYGVIYEGDSLTVGYPGSDANSYPTVLTSTIGPTFVKTNVASSGNMIDDIISQGAAQVDAAFLALCESNICVLWAGINNLIGTSETPEVIWGKLQTYLRARRAYGFKLVVGTVSPCSSGAQPVDFEVRRTALNALIRAGAAEYDALADIAADANIGVFGASESATYFTDKLHMTTAGYAIAAEIFRSAISSVL